LCPFSTSDVALWLVTVEVRLHTSSPKRVGVVANAAVHQNWRQLLISTETSIACFLLLVLPTAVIEEKAVND